MLGLGILLLGPGNAPAVAPAVVSAIFAGSHEGRLQVEIRGSEPINYAVIEGTDPFSVSLLLLNTTFGFPSEERRLPGPGLTRIRTGVLERDGSRLGRLDLFFEKSARYRVIKEGSRLLVRVDAPAPPGGLVFGQPPEIRTPPPVPAPAAPPRPAPAPPPRSAAAAVPLIMELRPESVGDEVRVVVGADGPLAWRSFTLQKPFRVVVDFERAQLVSGDDTLQVDDPLLRRIRTSQFTPTAVRLVLDLARPRPYWIERQEEGAVIHLGTRRP